MLTYLWLEEDVDEAGGGIILLELGLLDRKSNLSGVLFLAAVLKFCLPPVFVLCLLVLGGQADQAKSEN